jgi:hypothetical protein
VELVEEVLHCLLWNPSALRVEVVDHTWAEDVTVSIEEKTGPI